jgi:hypothetical protein
MHRHDPHAFGALLNDWRFAGLASFRISFHGLYEGTERQGAPLEIPREIDNP